jgi:hypothetical protein
MPNSLQDMIKLLQIGGGQQMAPQEPAGVVSPGTPGGPPPMMVAPPSGAGPGGAGGPGASGGSLPAQNMAMSPAQAGGPAARQPIRGYEGPYEFRSPQARTGAVVDNAIKSLQSFAMSYKQHQFESEAASANVIALASIAKPKQASNQQLTAQDMQAIEAAAKLEKKAPKLIEKAMTDPMSGAYVGVQRAYNAYAAQEMMQAKLAGEQQKAAAEAALAKQREAMAKFYENYKGQIEMQKLAQKNTKEQNKLIEKSALKGQKVTFDENGQAQVRPFTQAEIDADPMLKSQQQKELAYTKAAVARVKQGDLRLQIEAARVDQSKQRLAIETQYKLAQIDKLKSGAGGAQKYGTDELKRISLATMGKGYIDQMSEIVAKRPDLFGPAGWGDNAYNVALGNKYKDAMQFATLANLVAQPIVGIHVSRSMQLVKELQNFNSNLYQDAGVVAEKLKTESTAMQDAIGAIQKAHEMRPGGAPAATSGAPSSTESPTDKKDTGTKPPGW